MFAKPISLILVYIVTVFNLAILSSPLIAVLIPLMNRYHLNFDDNLLAKIKLAIAILLFLVSFLMLFYMLLDFLFGFALRSSLKNCVKYEKIKDYDFLSKIFSEVKYKFDEKSVKLYIKNSKEINAYAVSSLGGKAIVLSSGLVDHYLAESEDPKEFLYALRSILGHEMSHLVNKDFLPTFLIIANQKATNFVAFLLNFTFELIIKIISFIPYGGYFMARAMREINNLTNFVVRFFNRVVVYNLYEFLRRFISRSIEYRCDKQSGLAFGGKNMAFALSFLGESGYFTLFSTHPRTKNRIEKVMKIEASDYQIKPRFIDMLSNYFSIMFLIIICLYFAKLAHIDWLLGEFIHNSESLNRKLTALWQLLHRFF